MGHIFISYSHKDTKYAHKLADDLQRRGLDIWIDERLDYGSQWPHEIQKQLDSSDAFIIIMSPRSYSSEWVQSELQRAKRKLKPIFPLLLEGNEPWLSVESTQYYDVRNESLPDNKFYSALTRVVSIDQKATTFVPPSRKVEKHPTLGTKKPPQRNFLVPLIGGLILTGLLGIAGILFIVLPRLNPTPTVLPDITLPGTLPPDTLSSTDLVLQWRIEADRVVIEYEEKYWEKYEADTNVPGLYLRSDDISSFGDFLELNSDETFTLLDAGTVKSGSWKIDGAMLTIIYD